MIKIILLILFIVLVIILAYIGFNKFKHPLVIGSAEDNRYEIEKTKYSIISNLINKIDPFMINNKSSYEFNNIIERFLVSHYNEFGQILGSKIDIKSKSFQQLEKELGEKNYLFTKIEKIKKTIINEWNAGVRLIQRHKYVKSNKLDPLVTYSNYISFDGVNMNINPITISKLKRFKPIDVKLMILRYKIFPNHSQQWSIPRSVYMNLYFIGARYEAFASPLNSKLMGLNDAKFCSLFPDVDKPFGSIGNFFDVEMGSKEEQIWIMNPPFIEELLNKSMVKVLQSMDHCVKNKLKLTVYGIMPAWEDMDAYNQMKKSKYLKYDERMHKFHYYFESDKKITASFETHVYCLSTENRDFQGKVMFRDMKIN